jgi:hypothetical protein
LLHETEHACLFFKLNNAISVAGLLGFYSGYVVTPGHSVKCEDKWTVWQRAVVAAAYQEGEG